MKIYNYCLFVFGILMTFNEILEDMNFTKAIGLILLGTSFGMVLDKVYQKENLRGGDDE